METSNRYILIPSESPLTGEEFFCKQLWIILNKIISKKNLRMADGERRPVRFTESNCHSGKDMIDALTCYICKDILWEWCHNLNLWTSIAAISKHV